MLSPEKKSKITVLLCDDHAMVREGTRRLLEAEADIEVVGEASDGLEAIEMAQKLSPQVVAMDVSMPRMNGIEATRRVKETCPSARVLVLTAYDDFQYVARLLQNGASGYILKSAKSEELIAAIRATALGESVLDSKVARDVFSRVARRTAEKRGSRSSEPETLSPPETKLRKPPQIHGLTARETLVLEFLSRGLSNKEIAVELGVSPRTIQSHLASVFSKLGVASRTEAVVTALKLGLICKSDIGVIPGGS